MTWNLWWRFGPWEQRQPAILRTLERVKPDVVAIQEVWRDETTTQAEVLGTALGMESVYDSRFDIDGVGFGNAVLSRWPIVGSETHRYSNQRDDDAGRLVLRADVAGPDGSLQVFSTHLSWQLDESALRQLQVAELAGFVSDSGPCEGPAVVCGDLNAEPDSDEIRMLTGRAKDPVGIAPFTDAWAEAGAGAGVTWNRDNPHAAQGSFPDRRIDYILVRWPDSEDTTAQVISSQLAGNEPIDDVWPSDHFAVVADLEV